MPKKELTRFGVPEFNDDGSVNKIVEKPKKPLSNYCVTGLYVYDRYIWEQINKLEKSERGEFEISDINNWYADNGSVEFVLLEKGSWFDAGTHESLVRASVKMKDVIYEGWDLKDI